MRIILIIIGLLLLNINISLATNFIKGVAYENNVKNVFGTRMMVSFPSGKWEVEKIVKDKLYTYVDFKNTKEGAWFYIGIPNQNITGDYFRSSGVKKCQSDNKYKVHATGIDRSQLQTSYCIKSDLSWLVVQVNALKMKGNPLFWGRYIAYYPVRNSNVDSLDKSNLDRVGKILMKVIRNNIDGKPGSYAGSERLMKITSYSSSYNSTSSTFSTTNKFLSLSDKEVCLRATVSNGLGWENVNSNFGGHVKEAFKRKISLYECRKLTDRFPKIEQEIDETSNIKDSKLLIKFKLKELKSLLTDGLITQEQYEDKSEEIMKDF